MQRCLLALLIALSATASLAAPVTDELDISSNFIQLRMHPAEGGVIEAFSLLGTNDNLAGPGGLLEEGFGVGSPYLPNRRHNVQMEVLDAIQDRPVIEYRYDCEGPNITGLSVVRRMEVDPNDASVKVTWTIENKGSSRQWIAPWVRCDVSAGVATDARDLVELMSLEGKVSKPGRRYYPAARNWAAVTDPAELRTCYAVFNPDHLHSILTFRGQDTESAFQAHFVPAVLQPGKSWTTVYRLNAVSGLSHVDFATDEFAVQLDAEGGKLKALMSAARPIPGLEIHASVLAKNGRVWKLDPKKFDIAPGKLVRATFDWESPGEGAYEFLAELRQNGQPLQLAKDTGSPHGGFDTQFTVGNPASSPFEPWTSAPYALDHQPRVLERNLLADGPVRIWREYSMNKVLDGDVPDPQGAPRPETGIALARGESESLQVVFRPSPGQEVFDIEVVASPLERADGGGVIPVEDIRLASVGYIDSRIPSHYEGATGKWPDVLRPLQRFAALANQTVPVWITVTARPDTPAGLYRGKIQITGSGMDPVSVVLNVEVFDFELPARPALSTDFGLDLDAAFQLHRKAGGMLTQDELYRAFAKTALSHRVTLRGLTQLPAPANDYIGALAKFEQRLGAELLQRATSFSVPPALGKYPDQAARAEQWLNSKRLGERGFVQIADEPEQPAWQRVLDEMARWKTMAPGISPHVSTGGLTPFLSVDLNTWLVHAQVMDTLNGVEVLKRAADGKRVWWYVNHMPPRPYGNFLLDFAGIEHRILFWHTWALGITGMHYWDVHYVEPGIDPFQWPLDITPVNGDGLLLYPGKEGPLDSIRWEIIRDGVEDFDYLALFSTLRRALQDKAPGHALLQRAATVGNLQRLIPSLVAFPRDPKVLEDKRLEIARLIVEMQAALAR